jgi:hypothetical protein
MLQQQHAAVESEFFKSLAQYFMYRCPKLNHATVLELLRVKLQIYVTVCAQNKYFEFKI